MLDAVSRKQKGGRVERLLWKNDRDKSPIPHSRTKGTTRPWSGFFETPSPDANVRPDREKKGFWYRKIDSKKK
jgi:hypothetical protein